MKALFDSNILIDYLKGLEPAKAEIALYLSPAVSIVTWMEVMVGATPENTAITQQFLAQFQVIELNRQIAERAVKVRQIHKMRLPDAIIFATALETGLLLVTRNSKDFDAKHPAVRIPYTL